MTLRGENIMDMTTRERRSFIEQNITRPVSAVPDGWSKMLGSRERVFLTLCTVLGNPRAALVSMRGMDGYDATSGEEFDLADWASIDTNGDTPQRLYAGLLMDPTCEAFHRLALQAYINGVGAAKAVHAVVAVLGDETAKPNARVAAARTMADMASMLSKVGVEHVAEMRRVRDRADSQSALPTADAIERAEDTLRRLRELEAAQRALTAPAPPPEPKAEDLFG